MCLGIPMQVLAAGERGFLCEGRGARDELDLALVGAQPPGTWVLAARGCAVRVLSAEEAQRIGRALDALEAVLAGETNVDAFFADLIAREDRPLPANVPENP
ncbi:MAG TPA: HypC/HybG/HupF family hydrogenase formation chaperone [Casimicrobiaceae bacterium]|nr:HypC/HybG/HupF family hydrogenase formation chaperone [Casimicrobiaceae bacterium]